MSAPIIVAIFIAGGSDVGAETMRAAASTALGTSEVVIATPPARGDVLEDGRQLGATSIVQVTFTNEVAAIRVHRNDASPWEEDAIRFEPEDDATERWRTVGFAVAAMVVRIEEARPSPSPPAPEKPRPPEPPRRATLPLDAVLSGSLAADRFAWTGGPLLGGRAWLGERWGLGADLYGRFGESTQSRASLVVYGASLGGGYRYPIGPFELGARARVGFSRYALTRSSDDVTRTRWVGGTTFAAEAVYDLHLGLALIAAAGAEVAWGTTMVRVGAAEVAEIPSLRWIADIGGRFRF